MCSMGFSHKGSLAAASFSRDQFTKRREVDALAFLWKRLPQQIPIFGERGRLTGRKPLPRADRLQLNPCPRRIPNGNRQSRGFVVDAIWIRRKTLHEEQIARREIGEP